jgi:hypothetical protein
MKRTSGVVVAIVVGLSAVSTADGIGAFSAFKNGIGARALAMGGAFVAVANDATAPLWNPAGLAQLAGTRLTGMSTDLYGIGIANQYLGAVTPFASFGLGLGWERASMAGQIADSEGQPGGFARVEQTVVGSLATYVTDTAMAGANVKYYLADDGTGDGAFGYGLDAGLLVNVDDQFTIGAKATDLAGSALAWSGGASDVISGLYTAGLAMSLAEDRLILATDVDFDAADVRDTHVGFEFQVIDELALRGGVILTDKFQNYYFTVGAGIRIAGLYVDAAYIAQGTPGNTLVISVESELPLGGTPPDEEPDDESE